MQVVIMGAGIIGVTSAYFLARDGHDVTVLDRNEDAALDTSFANGGMLTPSQAAPWNSPGIAWKIIKWLGQRGSPLRVNPLVVMRQPAWARDFLRYSVRDAYLASLIKNARLAAYSLDILRELRGELEIDYDQASLGTLKIYRDDKSLAEAAGLLQSVNELRINYSLVDLNGLIALEPSLQQVSTKIAGGIHYPDDESGDAHLFTRLLTEEAGKLGVRFQYGTCINALKRNGNRLCHIDTDKGIVKADLYILAAGSYSPVLARTAGLVVPINPVKGYSLTFNTGDIPSGPSMPVIDESRHLAITPLGQRLRVSGGAEIVGYDRRIKPGRINMMMGFLDELYPGLLSPDMAGDALSWAGLRPYCCDGVPIIGPSSLANLYLNTGHGHLGWTLSLGSASLLSQMITAGKTCLEPQCYSMDRFKR